MHLCLLGPAASILAVCSPNLLGSSRLLAGLPRDGADNLVRDALNLVAEVRLSLVVSARGRGSLGRAGRTASLLDTSARGGGLCGRAGLATALGARRGRRGALALWASVDGEVDAWLGTARGGAR